MTVETWLVRIGLVAVACTALAVLARPVASPAAAHAERPFTSTVRPLPRAVRADLVSGGYWKRGCPVPLSQLRVLAVTHWDFRGNPRTGRLIVNRDVAEQLRRVFRRLYEVRFAIRYMQLDVYTRGAEVPAHRDFSGSFECREAVPSPCVGGNASGSWSNHAYGHAIDLNPQENPYVGCGMTRDPTRARYLDRTRLARGMVTPAVVRAFASIGWGWGGSWTGRTKDYMHFSTTGG